MTSSLKNATKVAESVASLATDDASQTHAARKSSRFSRASASYAVAAGAAAASSVAASGGIVYSGIQDVSIAQSSSFRVDFLGQAYSTVLLSNSVLTGVNYQGAVAEWFPSKLSSFFSNQRWYVKALAMGTLIDAASTGPGFFGMMSFGSQRPNAQFTNVTNRFLGVSFSTADESINYGWIRVSVNNATGSFIVHDWAHETTGAGIEAGAVPAPGALALLAAGASGLGLLRRRKRS